MSAYQDYLKDIESRKEQGLHPKPIEDADLVAELIGQIKQLDNPHREMSLQFFIYNTLPGTTSAAEVKSKFLKEIILGDAAVQEISPDFAFELLSHMKGGPSIEVLLDLALGNDQALARTAAEVLKTQVFLYEADTERLAAAFNEGRDVAREILESYAQAEFFTKLPDIEEKIQVVTYVAAVGDVSTDLLSPGNQAHSRSDRELHGKSLINPQAQTDIQSLQKQHPDKRVMLVAEKGTMGVGSSRMSGVNNVALWTGVQGSPYIPFINIAPIVGGTNGISPIFLTTVGVTGGIGIDLKNWVKKLDGNGEPIMDEDNEPVLEQVFSVDTGTVFTIDLKNKKLLNEDGSKELCDIQSALTPQKLEFIKAGGSYAVVFGKKLQTFAATLLGVEVPPVYASSKEISHEDQGLTAVEKIFNKNAVGVSPGKVLHAGSDVRVKVNIVGSQDTTGL
ncbi:MAG: bifunctional aconitate hydratase 2/2-methylisocitrate dehydratase, partial [Pseudomonadota bacterium]